MAITMNDEGQLVINDLVLNLRPGLKSFHHMNENDEMIECNQRSFYNFIIGFGRVAWKVSEDPDASYPHKRCARIMLRMMTRQIDKDSGEFYALGMYDPFTWVWNDNQ